LFVLLVEDVQGIRDLIPSASALSLTTFTLSTFWGTYRMTFPEEDAPVELSRLSNVRGLHLFPFIPRINHRIDFKQLTSLTVWLDLYVFLPFFTNAFPLLRQLEKLDLTVQQLTLGFKYYTMICVAVVNSVTDPSAVFQELCLTAALDLGQAQLFKRLPNLLRLQWNVVPDLYHHETCQEHPLYESFKDHPEILFHEVFREFKKPPVVVISVEESHRLIRPVYL
jgi:hypothetical protein